MTVTDATNAKVEFGGDGTQWVAGDYTATAKLGADAKFANFEISGAVSTGRYTCSPEAETYHALGVKSLPL